EPIARECLVIRAEQMPGTWRHHVAMSLHGASLAGLRRFAEAEPLLRDGYDKMEPPPAGAIHKRLALARLIQCYEAWGKPDETAKGGKLLPAEPRDGGK